MAEYDEPYRDVEQTEPHNGKSHDSTAAEGDAQAAVETLAGGIGGTCAGIGGGLHAEESGQAREEAAGDEGEGHPWVLPFEDIGHEGKDGCQHHEDDADDLILLFKVGHGTATHIAGNLAHTGRAFVGMHHRLKEVIGHAQCHD